MDVHRECKRAVERQQVGVVHIDRFLGRLTNMFTKWRRAFGPSVMTWRGNEVSERGRPWQLAR